MKKPTKTIDKRIDPRAVTRLAGVIRFGGADVACVVADRSRLGARLQVVSGRGIPDAFNLVLGAEVGTVRACVVWRRSNELGVRLAAPSPGFGRRMTTY